VFAACIFALLVSTVLQTVVPENDTLITAYVAALVLFLLSFRREPHFRYLLLIAICIGLLLGVKASAFLALPSLLVLAIVELLSVQRSGRVVTPRVIGGFLLLSFASFIWFSLGAGYLDNYRRFGHVLGPKLIGERKTFEGKSPHYISVEGTKNVLRYGIELLSLDGLPRCSPMTEIHHTVQETPKRLLRHLGIDLETMEPDRRPFLTRSQMSHPGCSHWGIFGVALMGIAVVLALMGRFRSRDARVLSVATVIFLLAQAYSSPYDQLRGRYFTAMAVFCAPLTGFLVLLSKRRLQQALILLCAGCLSVNAASAVIFSDTKQIWHPRRRLPDGSRSILTANRLAQLTSAFRGWYEILTEYEERVPKESIVGVATEGVADFAFFGEGLTRHIVPLAISSFDSTGPPRELDWVVFITRPYGISPQAGDISLGIGDVKLRRIRQQENQATP
jgi:4-amino-4-deoxy-L-arabinose transferase-like glycosyltransferase